ncbi:MAG: NUDIX hydrolase [Microgenomates group bacterium]
MISKFKFCPNCKGKLKKIGLRLLDCQSCGFHFYLNPCPTNALIIENNKGEILLVKRKLPPKKNFWDLPGGFLDFKETIKESLIREVKEELNINLKNFTFNYLGSFFDRYFYKGINYHTICFIFYTKIKQKLTFKPRDDVSEIKFLPKDKIPWEKIAFDGIKKALKDYIFKVSAGSI